MKLRIFDDVVYAPPSAWRCSQLSHFVCVFGALLGNGLGRCGSGDRGHREPNPRQAASQRGRTGADAAGICRWCFATALRRFALRCEVFGCPALAGQGVFIADGQRWEPKAQTSSAFRRTGEASCTGRGGGGGGGRAEVRAPDLSGAPAGAVELWPCSLRPLASRWEAQLTPEAIDKLVPIFAMRGMKLKDQSHPGPPTGPHPLRRGCKAARPQMQWCRC